MRARLQKFAQDAADAFWLLPAGLVAVGCGLGLGLPEVERSGLIPVGALAGWVYSGGETGARTLLGAIAGSAIGVAGTIFSITIAALTLASQQMGPRLLRNFTKDRGNQWTLGVLLGTFGYSLMVLRVIRGADENAFVPQMAVTIGILLGLCCIGMLVFFVHHVATRINVDTVIELVHRDLIARIDSLTHQGPAPPAIAARDWTGAGEIAAQGSGYLQQIDESGLADWAAEQGRAVKLLIKPGDYVFPGAVIAWVAPACEAGEHAVHRAIALGGSRTSPLDLTYAVRQLVEVAVRALSPGINDPMTAMSVLDRLGDALCVLAGRELPSGVVTRDGSLLLEMASPTYEEVLAAMLQLIRQSASSSPAVLTHLLGVMAEVARQEPRPERRLALRGAIDAAAAAGRRALPAGTDLVELERAHRTALQAARSPGRKLIPILAAI